MPLNAAFSVESRASPNYEPDSWYAGHTATTGLLVGLLVTVFAVLAYFYYATVQTSGLRRVQSELPDRNRKDSLQFLRIQGDLNSLGLAMRDMLDNDEAYPLSAWSAQFERIHTDPDYALQLEEGLAVARRTPEQREVLLAHGERYYRPNIRLRRQATDWSFHLEHFRNIDRHRVGL